MTRRLLMRRVFYSDSEASWANALHTYLVTANAWADIENKFARSARKHELEAVAAVGLLLQRLIAQSAAALGIENDQLIELRARRFVHRDDLHCGLPGVSRADIDVAAEARKRGQLLRDLNEQVKRLGLDLGLGGETPPQTLA
ncbi:hypothetical protein [Bradyrhizobium diazoefficiens]|uniref:hypothetical protein n=1 Tax=Bradyrhizobium diazoefficiens TaxID=1355477 RepID=UPI001FED37AA|nr:hypothetical protein [Bradyrhizobium diazoefficiens]